MYREFMEEALNSETMSVNEKDNIKRRLKRFFAGGDEVFNYFYKLVFKNIYKNIYFVQLLSQIYRGYVDDPRNTDNAWMETVVYNFHDEDGLKFKGIRLNPGEESTRAKWIDIDSVILIYIVFLFN